MGKMKEMVMEMEEMYLDLFFQDIPEIEIQKQVADHFGIPLARVQEHFQEDPQFMDELAMAFDDAKARAKGEMA